MKSILFVLDSLCCGGAEKSLISLLSLIDYSTYSVDLLLFKRGGIFEQFVPEQVRISEPLKYAEFTKTPLRQAVINSIKQGSFKMLHARLKFTLDIRRKKKKNHGAQVLWTNISNVVEKNSKKYDVAIAYSQGFPTYYVAEKVVAAKKYAWVNINYMLAGYDKNYDYRFYSKFTKIIAVSDSARDILAAAFPEFTNKIKVIYDINNPFLINTMADTGEVYEDNFNGVRLLTIGRLVPQKGYDIAIAVCKKLKEIGVDFRWYVLGDGVLRDEIREYLRNNNLEQDFIMLGVKANPYSYIKNCDIYVQTSKFEGFGLAIAEARMLNKPIVTTNFDVVYDQMIDEKNGLVVDMNADAVCNGIIRVHNDDSLRNSIVEYLKNEKKGNIEEFEKFNELVQ